MLTLDQGNAGTSLESRVENGLERADVILEGMERRATLNSRGWSEGKESNTRRRVMSCFSSLRKMETFSTSEEATHAIGRGGNESVKCAPMLW